MRHELRGQSFATLSACAAGAHAIGTAARMIQRGDADAVVTGGSEAALTPLATRRVRGARRAHRTTASRARSTPSATGS